MKRMFIVFVLLTALLFAVQLFALGMEEKNEPVIKEFDGFIYCCMEFTGPYSNMEKEIKVFMEEFFKQGMMPMDSAMSAYFNSPEMVKEEDLKWAFGFLVPEGTKVKEPLKIIEVEKQTACVYLHNGPYKNLPKSYDLIFKFIEKQGYKTVYPVYDKYLNNPMQVKPEELKTEVIVPVAKK